MYLYKLLTAVFLGTLACCAQLQADEPVGKEPFYGADVRADDYSEAPFSNGGCIKLYGEFIYWKAVQDQTQYAVEFLPPTTLNFQKVRVVNPKFEYKPGFRVGASYDLPCSNWNVDLDWVRLHQETRSHVSSPIGGIFAFASNGLSFADVAKNRWRFHFDVVDLIFRRNCCFCDLAFSPYVGVKAACILQNLRTRFSGLFTDGTTLSGHDKRRNQFRGIGPSFGLDASWDIGCGLSLSGGFEFALLYGKIKAHQKPHVTVSGLSQTVSIRDNKRDRVRPAVDANIGLDWSTCVCDKFLVQIGVGYEVQYWWNQWQPLSSVAALIQGSPSSQGDLMLQGLTARLGVLF